MVWPLLRCRHEAVPPLKYPWLPASCVPLRYILNAWSREGELSKEIFLFKKKKNTIHNSMGKQAALLNVCILDVYIFLVREFIGLILHYQSVDFMFTPSMFFLYFRSSWPQGSKR